MPRTEKQNEAIRAATRTNILNSAMRLFAQKGYAHTTTRNIATAAGLSVGLMYHYFANKESLLQAVFDFVMARIDERITAVLQTSPPGEVLPNLLHAIFDLLASEPEFWSLFYMLRTQPAIMAVLGDAFRERTAMLRSCFVAELAQAGWPQPELEGYYLYSVIEGAIQQYLLDPANYPLAEVVEKMIAQFGGKHEPV
ncbi:TetR/AcrR family transcriptional regulator [Candidatus Leptofilum sp.]|uniref:TetR/AcrR family transcriptional regulator n=1 Tax=Candidatus Leptofilum sp. TaxID=3241576 RepID=UPI003B5BB23C